MSTLQNISRQRTTTRTRETSQVLVSFFAILPRLVWLVLLSPVLVVVWLVRPGEAQAHYSGNVGNDDSLTPYDQMTDDERADGIA